MYGPLPNHNSVNTIGFAIETAHRSVGICNHDRYGFYHTTVNQLRCSYDSECVHCCYSTFKQKITISYIIIILAELHTYKHTGHTCVTHIPTSGAVVNLLSLNEYNKNARATFPLLSSSKCIDLTALKKTYITVSTTPTFRLQNHQRNCHNVNFAYTTTHI